MFESFGNSSRFLAYKVLREVHSTNFFPNHTSIQSHTTIQIAYDYSNQGLPASSIPLCKQLSNAESPQEVNGCCGSLKAMKIFDGQKHRQSTSTFFHSRKLLPELSESSLLQDLHPSLKLPTPNLSETLSPETSESSQNQDLQLLNSMSVLTLEIWKWLALFLSIHPQEEILSELVELASLRTTVCLDNIHR